MKILAIEASAVAASAAVTDGGVQSFSEGGVFHAAQSEYGTKRVRQQTFGL